MSAATDPRFTPPPRPAPTTRRALAALWVLGGWLLAALLTSTEPAKMIGRSGEISPIPWRVIFTNNLVAFGWWAALTPAIVWTVRRIAARRPPLPALVAAHAGAAVVFVAIDYVLSAHLVLPAALFRIPAGWAGVASILPRAVAAYALAAGATLVLDAHRDARAREREAAALALRASRLEGELAGARLEVLRAQLHPHFLSNALHGIAALVDWQPAEARWMLARLGELLRLAVEAAEEPEVPLTRELDWVERYVELQQVRFDDRLRVDVRVDPRALAARVPPLVLQPLVENAIQHGVEPRTGGGCVTVTAERVGDRLRLRVTDDGPGPAGGGGGGVGLRNTRERLRALYGDAAAVTLRPVAAGGAEATVELPFREAGTAPAAALPGGAAA